MALCEDEEEAEEVLAETWSWVCLDKTDPLISWAFFWFDLSLFIILSIDDDLFFSSFIYTT